MMLEGFNWMTRNRWPVVRFKWMTFLKELIEVVLALT